MSKYTTIIILAFLIILIPFLGFPGFWRTLFLVLFGLGIIICAFLLRGEFSNGASSSFNKDNEVYVENGMNNYEDEAEDKK